MIDATALECMLDNNPIPYGTHVLPVRPPRLPLASPEREGVLDLVRRALARRPALG